MFQQLRESEPPRQEGKHRFLGGTCVDCGHPLEAETAERVNLVTGDTVRLVGQKPGETFTIESSSIYEQRKFYRLREINGGLFLRESLRLDAQGDNKACITVSNEEYLALERVAYEMREALVARQEADATWKNDRTAHNVCHEMTKKADDLARTALAAFDKAKECK